MKVVKIKSPEEDEERSERPGGLTGQTGEE